MISRGQQRSIEVGRAQHISFVDSRDRPKLAEVSKGQLGSAEVSRGQQRSAEVIRGQPRSAEISRGLQRSAEVGRGRETGE